MMMDPYTWLKALHVAAAITFVAGVLGVAVFLASVKNIRIGIDVVNGVRGWDRRVTTPAMLLLWALGLSLAMMGGWLHNSWLLAKILFVIGLSGVHGMQSATLRRMVGGVPAAAPLSLVAPLVVISVLVITVLVVVKP